MFVESKMLREGLFALRVEALAVENRLLVLEVDELLPCLCQLAGGDIDDLVCFALQPRLVSVCHIFTPHRLLCHRVGSAVEKVLVHEPLMPISLNRYALRILRDSARRLP